MAFMLIEKYSISICGKYGKIFRIQSSQFRLEHQRFRSRFNLIEYHGLNILCVWNGERMKLNCSPIHRASSWVRRQRVEQRSGVRRFSQKKNRRNFYESFRMWRAWMGSSGMEQMAILKKLKWLCCALSCYAHWERERKRCENFKIRFSCPLKSERGKLKA